MTKYFISVVVFIFSFNVFAQSKLTCDEMAYYVSFYPIADANDKTASEIQDYQYILYSACDLALYLIENGHGREVVRTSKGQPITALELYTAVTAFGRDLQNLHRDRELPRGADSPISETGFLLIGSVGHGLTPLFLIDFLDAWTE